MPRNISPFKVVKEPFKMEGDPGIYDHSLQRAVGASIPMGSYQTNTFGGTQTYGINGQPSDSDNDTDRNG
ncbi:MAG: hypothetical protein EBX92_09145 [Actinobacteria bacterium]|nr:hypothetical protein [Actinomycetota bacterium]